MKAMILLASVAAFAATSVSAEERTRTQTFDGPNYEGSRTVTRDRNAGTLSRDAEVTRKADGAVATREYDRARTDTGVTASGSSTNFAGETRSFEYARTRTDTGSTTSGTATSRNGETFTLSGERNRTDTGFTANQNIVNGAGTTVYNRDVTASRANGQVTRSVDVTRAEGFHRPRPHRDRPRHNPRRRLNR